MEIEKLKSTWRMMGEQIGDLEAENRRIAEKLAAGKAETSKKKLAKLAKVGIACAILLPILAPLLYYLLNFQMWIAILYGVFGVIMGVANIFFYNKIMDNDYLSLTLVKALSEAYKIRIYLRNVRILGISMGLVVILSMAIEMIIREKWNIVVGMSVGCALGMIIGIKGWTEESRLSRQIIRDLREALNDSTKDISANDEQ